MEKYEIVKVESNEDESLSIDMDKRIDKVFKSLIDINEHNLIVKKNCKFCNHEFRFDAERFWEKNNYSYTKTLEFLNKKIRDKNMTLPEDAQEKEFCISSIRYHLKSHYLEQERQIRLQDYASKIKDLMLMKQNKLAMLEMGLAVCQENLARIATVDTNHEMKNEKVRSESINKTIQTMLAIIETQGKLEGDISPTKMVQQKLVDIWVETIQKEKSDVKKQILYKMLKDFVNEIEGKDQ